MQPIVPFLIVVGVVLLMTLAIVNTVALGRGMREQGEGSEAEESPPPAEEPGKEPSALPKVPEPVASRATPAVPLPEIERLRGVEGVRGVAVWGEGGALLSAQGDILEGLLPQAADLMRAAQKAGEGVGTGSWLSFQVEGLKGTIHGARVQGLSLLVVSDSAADKRKIERLLFETASAVGRRLDEGATYPLSKPAEREGGTPPSEEPVQPRLRA